MSIRPIKPGELEGLGLGGLLGGPSQNSSMMGLLGNPMLGAGLGLLSAGYDSRINPFQSAMQGLAGTQQFKLLEQKRKREEEQYQRQQKAIEEFQKITGSMPPIQTPMGPPTAQGQMGMQNRPDPMAGMMGALAQSGDLRGAAGMYTDLQRIARGTDAPSNVREWEYFSNLSQEDQKRYLAMKRASQMVDLGGGGVGVLDQMRRTPEQIVSPTQAATNEATASGITTRAEDVVQREIEAPKEIQSISDLQREIDWITSNKDDFGSVFGSIQGRTPDLRQSAVNAESHRKRIASLLTLAARGQLKGQGTVSDFESKMLGDAATLLNDRTISDDEAFAEVQRIQAALNARKDRVPGEAGQTPEAVEDEYERMKRELLGG